MRDFNSSHIIRITGDREEATRLGHFIADAKTEIKTVVLSRSGYGKTYFIKSELNHYDVDKAIEVINKKITSPKTLSHGFNFTPYLEILYKVKEDLLTYDKVPDTSDVWDESMVVSRKESEPRKTRKERVAEKRKRQREFVEKWNKFNNL